MKDTKKSRTEKKVLTGSQALLESLVQEGVTDIFGYPGGAIMPVYDALYDYKEKLNHILVRHEQGAAHAAEGYARLTGKAGVALVTSGPGATNLVTGLADAMIDSVPIVCITGQVASHLLGTDAFQEADVIGITTPVTKWNYQVSSAAEIAEVVAKAFYIAQSGRPGPVLIDITKDAQFEKCDFSYKKITHMTSYQPTIAAHPKQIKLAAQLINTAKRPYLFAGHGILISQASKALQKVAEKADIPVASTLHGLSTIPENHPLFVGMLGMHGNYGANKMVNQADVIIAVGMRFDDRVTGDLSRYAKQAKIIHIDIDPAELNKIVQVDVPIVADAKNALEALLPHLKKQKHPEWIESFREYDAIEHEKVIKHMVNPLEGEITMAEVVHRLSEKTKGEAVIVTDVGQHQMIAARYYKATKPDSFITSGGLGTMGFGLPAAIGAKVAAPDREVILIVGDGGFQMNIQELATIAQEKLLVKVLILNNNFLGMVRQWQEMFFEKRYSFVDMQNPDFVAVAKGFYLDAEKITERDALDNALDQLLGAKEARVLEVVVHKEGNVFPMIPTGAGVDEVRLE